MKSTMKSAVVHAFGEPLSIEELPIPIPGPGQALVKIAACGVCHTDLHAANGDWPVKPALPFIPGHEGVGTVVALGPGVTAVKEGDRVGIPWLYSACGACECCVTGWETLCPGAQYSGYTVNGGFAEYALADVTYVGHIPDSVDFFSAAPLLCAGVTTYKGLKETEARPGQWVAISGIGGLGHLAVQYAVAMGLKVVAVDVSDDKLDLARRCGADAVVNASAEGDTAKAVIDATDGGAHGVLVTAPAIGAFHDAVAMTRRRGTCVLVGLPPGDFPTPLFDVVLKRITIRGSLVGTRQDLREALQFAADGKVRADYHLAPLSSINAVFTRLCAGKIEGRVVLDLTV